MNTRRNFIRLTGAGVIAAGAAPLLASVVSCEPLAVTGKRTETLFNLGIAGYTFFKLPFEKAVEVMKTVNVTNMSLKDNFLPLQSSADQISSVTGRFRSGGINIYTVGVIYMKNKDDVNQAFEYAKSAGVKMIVGAPNVDMLPLVEKKVKEYNIRVAIHNHGPDNTLFPTATDIWNHIKDLDKGIGICLDIGHTVRAGQDPAADTVKYASRLFDLHIKDVTEASKDGHTIEMGRGIINIPAFVAALRKVKYSGMCSLEFEKDMGDPLAGIAESIGYFRGVLAASGNQ